MDLGAEPLTRRDFGLGAGALAVANALSAESARAAPEATLSLRLLETSDLHMYVLDWDYFRAKIDPEVGFAKVATLIEAARKEAVNSLTFDNGDLIQGSPLGDFLVTRPPPSGETPHPIVAVMRELGYDAATLGNHEFNFGLPFLEASIANPPFPFVLANVTRAGGAPFLPPYAVLARKLKDGAGGERELKIGVIGFTPPQILEWDKSRLAGKLEAGDIVAAARRYVPELRAKCDLLVALSHAGIAAGDYIEGEENASLHLASVPGIDVIFTGHSHRVFPGKDYAGRDEGIDAVAGRLNGVPAVMPGFWGSHLGVVDLELALADGRWRVTAAKVATRPIYEIDGGKAVARVDDDAKVVATVAAAHQGALAWVDQPIGALDRAVNSYFVWTGFDPASALVNAAQLEYARSLIPAKYADLPLLSVAAPYRAGYTPDDFVDLTAGPTPLRGAADLYLYGANTIVVVKVTGDEIREWLEFAARAFARINTAIAAPQALRDNYFPSYNFDVIAGVEYEIDPTQPARYDSKGNLNLCARRIARLSYQGAPIDPKREFVVVANNYRADGGGNFPALRNVEVVLRAPDCNRDAVLAYFRSRKLVTAPRAFPWRFVKQPKPIAVTFDTGREAAAHLSERPGLRAVGDGAPGYLRVAFEL